jgi:hypothetical protein
VSIILTHVICYIQISISKGSLPAPYHMGLIGVCHIEEEGLIVSIYRKRVL